MLAIDGSNARPELSALRRALAVAEARADRAEAEAAKAGDCRKFRVWAGMMGKEETSHATTQRAYDP